MILILVSVVAIVVGLWSMSINRRLMRELDDMEQRIDKVSP